MSQDIHHYFSGLSHWKNELLGLREIALSCGLTEEYKWKQACYTYKGKNICILGHFKDYFALLFFQGSLMRDDLNMLIQPTKDSQAGRQLRFTSVSQIIEQADAIRVYIHEGIRVAESGEKITYKPVEAYSFPEELDEVFASDIEFKQAFESLTPGRQKGYLLFFDGAKQSKTKTTRILSNRDRILAAKGLNDCICGQSKKYPRCDGSHKHLS